MNKPKGSTFVKQLPSWVQAIIGEESVDSTFSFLFIVLLVLAFKSSVLDANNIPSGSMIPTLKIGDFLFVNKMRYSLRLPFTEKELIRYDDPKRGDIVTFVPPEGALREPGESREGWFPKRFVKRVIGIPGDRIRITPKPILRDGKQIYYGAIEYMEKGSQEFKPYEFHETDPGSLLYDLDDPGAVENYVFQEQKPGFQHYVIEGPHIEKGTDCYKPTGCLIPENYYMMQGDNRPNSFDSRDWGFVPREDVLGKALMIYFSINWKDHVCQYKSGKDLADLGQSDAPRYEGEELESKCKDTGYYNSMPKMHSSYLDRDQMGWLKSTILYRIPRMEIRWSRIGTILE
ncbi:signal peptidase I [Leptospira langatensis]|uniref:Signal peptidase I n=1 Tax=Leptospira langatensis TaxID=2484983 RepID=A0A5F1ZWE1_9LEPT|nr:signal peptidase I [Leptospira langatensis]TGK00103.1 signal peptidase I [Leptospira langatensis]TGL42737.1 signal peptidase I [Leptospira langatensis]